MLNWISGQVRQQHKIPRSYSAAGERAASFKERRDDGTVYVAKLTCFHDEKGDEGIAKIAEIAKLPKLTGVTITWVSRECRLP